MNEDALNTSVRKFLKVVGVTSQREIEKAVREAAAGGALSDQTLSAKMVLTIPSLNLTHEIKGDIDIE